MMEQIFVKLNEGGAFFTYPILVIAIVLIVYLIRALRSKERIDAIEKLLVNYGWLAFSWGNLGSAAGLIVAFDALKAKPLLELTGQNLAGGLKMVLICSLFSAFVFSLSRLFVIILRTIVSRNK